MDDSSIEAPDLLVPCCPNCSTPAPDDFEVLDLGRVVNMHCAACDGHYRLLLVECSHCGAECLVHTLGDADTACVLGETTACAACHKPCNATSNEAAHGSA